MRNTWAIIKQYVFLNTFGAILREGISSRSISHNTHYGKPKPETLHCRGI